MAKHHAENIGTDIEENFKTVLCPNIDNFHPSSINNIFTQDQRNFLNNLSTYILIGSYGISLCAGRGYVPFMPSILQQAFSKVPFGVSPLVHRLGYASASAIQAGLSLTSPADTYQDSSAHRLKNISDVIALGAVASYPFVAGSIGFSAFRKTPASIERIFGKYIKDNPSFTKFKQFAEQELSAKGKKILDFTADSAGGFSTTGLLTSISMATTIGAAKLESDKKHYGGIVNNLNAIYPELEKKEIIAIANENIPHMHEREAGYRLTGAVGSAGGAFFNLLSLKNPIFGSVSGYSFAIGLLAPSLPSGNLPNEKRFNNEINNWYIGINESVKSTQHLLHLGVGTLLMAAMIKYSKIQPKPGESAAELLQRIAPVPDLGKKLLGQADNWTQITAMGVSALYGKDPVKHSPAALRQLNQQNPRLSQQESTKITLEKINSGEIKINRLAEKQSTGNDYTNRLLEASARKVKEKQADIEDKIKRYESNQVQGSGVIKPDENPSSSYVSSLNRSKENSSGRTV